MPSFLPSFLSSSLPSFVFNQKLEEMKAGLKVLREGGLNDLMLEAKKELDTVLSLRHKKCIESDGNGDDNDGVNERILGCGVTQRFVQQGEIGCKRLTRTPAKSCTHILTLPLTI
jgi:hypothetical protein